MAQKIDNTRLFRVLFKGFTAEIEGVLDMSRPFMLAGTLQHGVDFIQAHIFHSLLPTRSPIFVQSILTIDLSQFLTG